MSTEVSTTNLLESIDKTLEVDVVARHSYFQLKYFIIGKEPTHQARLWQCLRELKARKESLKSINWEIEDAEDNLELLNIEIQELENSQKSEYEKMEHETANKVLGSMKKKSAIQFRKQKRQKLAQEENLERLLERKKWITEEAQFFLESYQNLAKIEPIKHFDDLDSQKEYWGKKLADQMQLKLLLQNPLDTELVKTVLALPDDMPVKKDMVKRLDTVQSELMRVKEEYKKKLLDNKDRADKWGG